MENESRKLRKCSYIRTLVHIAPDNLEYTQLLIKFNISDDYQMKSIKRLGAFPRIRFIQLKYPPPPSLPQIIQIMWTFI